MAADGNLSELEAMEVVSVASDEAGDNEQIDFSVREEYPLCRFALANLLKTKILAASCKPILATTHVRFCEAMGSKIPRILSQSSLQRPARKLRD